MKNITKILVSVMIICWTNSYSQIPNIDKSLLSPTAASLGIYGEIPVSLFTGIPNISIPLFEIETINFPITLQYHAAGVRPDQQSGWVGTGWSLNAGGVITRTVKDVSDEFIILPVCLHPDQPMERIWVIII